MTRVVLMLPLLLLLDALCCQNALLKLSNPVWEGKGHRVQPGFFRLRPRLKEGKPRAKASSGFVSLLLQPKPNAQCPNPDPKPQTPNPKPPSPKPQAPNPKTPNPKPQAQAQAQAQARARVRARPTSTSNFSSHILLSLHSNLHPNHHPIFTSSASTLLLFSSLSPYYAFLASLQIPFLHVYVMMVVFSRIFTPLIPGSLDSPLL
ncbi:hypothetical protein GX48_00673 [Paracoccidioides brasiliensis]|nr:hypothetical protein GX48_00673 [Paracoccidioides brasiliensis]